MKKLSVIFVVVMAFVLSSCSLNGNKLFDIDYAVCSSKTLKFVTEKETYSSDDTVIRYSITNISDKEDCIAGDDDCFELHKLVDGEWKWVGTKEDHAWNALGLILEPNQTEKREIKLDEYYHLPLEKGKYRIAMEHIVSNTFEIL